MKSAIKKAVIVVSCVCLSACTTLQTVAIAKDDATTQRPKLAEKEDITVVLATGEQIALRVTQSDQEYLSGLSGPSSEPRRIAWSEVVRVDQRVPDALKSTLLVLGVLVAIGVAAGYMVGKHLARNLAF
ncbi:hypothetical protein [Paucibacter sp. B51]|uniref:hypothetical protein n=1 Tax=Paucibacter sp. B51 TaxID=2993315 RepID=UPI0022EBC8C0|nr:hypothetical protein [Paucibacter sp. B51]